MIYQFAFHKNVKPEYDKSAQMFQLYEKLESGKALTREEKDTVANRLYGTFGSRSCVYRMGGWAANFSGVLFRFLVNVRYCGWKQYYAPDKTSLRKAIGSYSILEIIKT